MIKVYFENKCHAVLVAIFDDEEIYNACLPTLEKQAKEQKFDKVTESLVNIDIDEVEYIVNTHLSNI